MKRLCIYITYDKQGIVDEYIGYMLKELKTCISHLVVVSNQIKIVRGQHIIEEYADQIFYRNNIGFDAGGFKDALCDYIGWDQVREYDELVLVNDSCFGPFRPMTEIFDEMRERKIDFWGLLKHGHARNEDGKEIKEHIQSFFVVIRDRMLHDICFEEYWKQMPYYYTYSEVIDKYEVVFTQYFADKGFSYDVFADAGVNISGMGINNYNQYGMIPYELVSRRNFPFFKKKFVTMDNICLQTQENFRRCFNYISNNTKYDVNLIWKNMIRTMNVADIYRSFHLRYIISDAVQKINGYKVLVALYISHRESTEYISEYVAEIKNKVDIRIFTADPEIYQYYQTLGYACREYSYMNFKDMICEFGTYDLVGVVHDVDISAVMEPNYVGKAAFYSIWENLIKNPAHIDGIIKTFQEEPWLGLLISPTPNFGKYFASGTRGWNGKLMEVQEFIKKMNMNCQLSDDKPPVGIASNFWIRGEILSLLQDIDEKDMDIMPYALTYVAQHAGFCSGIVESADYASMDEVNLYEYLSKIINQVGGQFHANVDSYFELEKVLFRGAIEVLRSRRKKIYIYGTGWMAERYKECFANIEGYIVSDGQPKKDEIDGVKVSFLSDIKVTDATGVVICTDKEKQKQIVPLLLDKGINDYIYI